MPQQKTQQKNRKSRFYEGLNRRCDQTPKHDALPILGDFNAKIGKELANQLRDNIQFMKK
jgi:hypothetical protein